MNDVSCKERPSDIDQPFASVRLDRWEVLADYQKQGWIYRGQRCAAWSLKSSLDRFAASNGLHSSEVLEVERRMLREFRRVYHRYANYLPDDQLEWLAIMQHHGCPTRLLDWTYSIYVAAYFALEDASCEAAVLALNGRWAVEQTATQLKAIGHKDADRFWEPFDESHAELVKNWFFSARRARCAAPLNSFRLNERLAVQRGVFLCQGDPTVQFYDNLTAFPGHAEIANVIQIRLPLRERRKALASLFNMNITRASLFPGVDGFAQSLGVYHSLLEDTWRKPDAPAGS